MPYGSAVTRSPSPLMGRSALVVAGVLTSGAALSAEPPPGFAYRAPADECPTQQSFLSAVAERRPRHLERLAAEAWSVEIHARAGRYDGTVARYSGAEVVNEVHADSCAELVHALSFSIATWLDDEGATPAPPPPEQKAKPVTRRSVAKPAIAAAVERPSSAQERATALGLNLEILRGITPTPIYGLSVFGEWWWGVRIPSLGARASMLQGVSDFATNFGEKANFLLVAGRAELCLRTLRVSAVVLAPCVGTLLGSLQGKAERSHSGRWLELAAALHISTAASLNRVFFDASMGPALTLSRSHYDLGDEPELPYASKDFGLRVGFSVGVGAP